MRSLSKIDNLYQHQYLWPHSQQNDKYGPKGKGDARALHRCRASCMVIVTLGKLKTTMYYLNLQVEKMI